MAAKKAIKPKFKNPDELRAACEAYFGSLTESGDPPTQSSLALHIGLTDERRFREQSERQDQGFADIVDWCRARIASWHEKEVSKIPAYSMAWLRKNRPEEWGEQSDVTVTGSDVTINIQRIYE